jgi:hypothetical protein
VQKSQQKQPGERKSPTPTTFHWKHAPALKKLKGLLSALLVTDENDVRSTCVGRENGWQKQRDGGQSMRLDASI